MQRVVGSGVAARPHCCCVSATQFALLDGAHVCRCAGLGFCIDTASTADGFGHIIALCGCCAVLWCTQAHKLDCMRQLR